MSFIVTEKNLRIEKFLFVNDSCGQENKAERRRRLFPRDIDGDDLCQMREERERFSFVLS